MSHDVQRLDVARLRELAASCGKFERSQLFVGTSATSGARSTLHFDQMDNLYLQLSGTKRFRLYEPTEAGHLYAWPCHHPNDRRTQVDLARAEAEPAHAASAFPRLAQARCREVVLHPGELLFLPAYWWHEVTTLDVPDGTLNVSVNFWFKIDWDTHLERLPLRATFLLEAVRQLEMLVAETLGSPRLLAPFMRAAGNQMRTLRHSPDGGGGGGTLWPDLHAGRPSHVQPDVWEGLFEFIAWKAVLLVGHERARTLLDDLCDPARFECIAAPG